MKMPAVAIDWFFMEIQVAVLLIMCELHSLHHICGHV